MFNATNTASLLMFSSLEGYVIRIPMVAMDNYKNSPTSLKKIDFFLIIIISEISILPCCEGKRSYSG